MAATSSTLTRPLSRVGILSVWILACIAGLAFFWIYESTPGQEGDNPESWPSASTLTRASDRPTLVMFLHPKCPCSRASVEEVSRLLANYPEAFALRFVFFQPDTTEDSWVQTDLWKTVRQFPHAEVVIDKEAREARRFGAVTSGDTYLFDPSGELRFHGGLTPGRGHIGENAGLESLRQLARSQTPSLTRFAVFGCPITDDRP